MRKEDCNFATINIILQRLAWRVCECLTLPTIQFKKGFAPKKLFYECFSPAAYRAAKKQQIKPNKTGRNKANQPTNQTIKRPKQPNTQPSNQPRKQIQQTTPNQTHQTKLYQKQSNNTPPPTLFQSRMMGKCWTSCVFQVKWWASSGFFSFQVKAPCIFQVKWNSANEVDVFFLKRHFSAHIATPKNPPQTRIMSFKTLLLHLRG